MKCEHVLNTFAKVSTNLKISELSRLGVDMREINTALRETSSTFAIRTQYLVQRRVVQRCRRFPRCS